MCGIFGVSGRDAATPSLLEGLRRMEYRGYDSAGLCLAHHDGLHRRRAVGRVTALEPLTRDIPTGTCGIAHTRWATHGGVTEANAHPHSDAAERVAIVHNGILENEVELRAELVDAGASFASETDSELIALVLADQLDGVDTNDDDALLAAWASCLDRLEGSFALAAVVAERPDQVLLARRFSPLVVGHGETATYAASDAASLAGLVDEVTFLEEGDIGLIGPQRLLLHDGDSAAVTRDRAPLLATADSVELGGYPHHMLKEIHEQPGVFRACLKGRLTPYGIEGVDLPIQPELVRVLACGTSYNAGLLGRAYIEQLAQVPVIVDHAHEFRFSTPAGPRALVLAISQSGETADTLAAVRTARERGYPSVGIVNTEHSSLTRLVDSVLTIRAGTEVGVASTKAFLGQVLASLLLALEVGRQRGTLPVESLRTLADHMRRFPTQLDRLLASRRLRTQLDAACALFEGQSSAFFLGRNLSYPVALEGALKLKEISYIHAEGYAGGELKHGPLALITDGTPVVVVASDGPSRGKLFGNAREVAARGAKVIVLAREDDKEAESHGDVVIRVPATHQLLQPLLSTVVTQLLAYQVALDRGCDVDRPRNLAKSVTVE